MAAVLRYGWGEVINERVSEVLTLMKTKGDDMFTVTDYFFQAKFRPQWEIRWDESRQQLSVKAASSVCEVL